MALTNADAEWVWTLLAVDKVEMAPTKASDSRVNPAARRHPAWHCVPGKEVPPVFDEIRTARRRSTVGHQWLRLAGVKKKLISTLTFGVQRV